MKIFLSMSQVIEYKRYNLFRPAISTGGDGVNAFLWCRFSQFPYTVSMKRRGFPSVM